MKDVKAKQIGEEMVKEVMQKNFVAGDGSEKEEECVRNRTEDGANKNKGRGEVKTMEEDRKKKKSWKGMIKKVMGRYFVGEGGNEREE